MYGCLNIQLKFRRSGSDNLRKKNLELLQIFDILMVPETLN